MNTTFQPNEPINAGDNETILSTNSLGASSVFAADVNGDGHMDLREMVMSKVNFNRPT